MATCPMGHQSASTDYCDVCGAPLNAAVPEADPAVAAEKLLRGEPTPVDTGGVPASGPMAGLGGEVSAKPCPHCSSLNSPDALFCEHCGYDYTTGTPPRGAGPLAEAASAQAEGRFPGQVEAPTEDGARITEPGVLPGDVPVAGAAASASASPSFDLPLTPLPVGEHGEPVPADAATPLRQPVPLGVARGEVEPAPEYSSMEPAPLAPAAPEMPGGEETAAGWVAEVWIDPDWYEAQESPDPLPSPGLPRVVPLRDRALIGRPSTSRGIHPDVDCDPDNGCSRRQAELSSDGTRWWIEDLGSANGTYVGQAGETLPATPIAGRTELADGDRVYVGSWTRLVVRRATQDDPT